MGVRTSAGRADRVEHDPDSVRARIERRGAFEETVAFPAPEVLEAPASASGPTDDLVGETLGQYRLDEVIGQGSMARVYRAEHLGLGRQSAVKVLNAELIERQPQMVERFRAEARAVAGLVHPHVVMVHNLGSDRGHHYIEMEFVPGSVSLRDTVVRDGAFDSVRATKLIRQVTLALAAAHSSGLIHRDVKPANVLLDDQGRAKLADFGLVRRVDEGGRDHKAGRPNLAGTPMFMAPELFSGAPPSPQTDLYAVGVTYFNLLSARLPFVSSDISRLIRLHQRMAIPDIRKWVPDAPEEVRDILRRLLAKSPDARPPSAEALADELKRMVGHLREIQGLVEESLEGLDCFVQAAGKDLYRVVVPTPGDRLHEVYIEAAEGPDNEALLQVFSVCAPADARHYEFALKLNDRLTIGGLSLHEMNGVPMFVMTRTYLRDLVTPTDLRGAVLEIARQSDWVEHELTRCDVY